MRYPILVLFLIYLISSFYPVRVCVCERERERDFFLGVGIEKVKSLWPENIFGLMLLFSDANVSN